MQERYVEEVQKRLPMLNENDDVQQIWEKIVQSITKAADIINVKPKRKKNEWFNQECEEEIEKRKN